MKGFIEVEALSGMRMLIAIDVISVLFDKPCFLMRRPAEDGEGWMLKQSYEEVKRLIEEAQKGGGE